MKTFKQAILVTAFFSPLTSQAGGLYLYEIGTNDVGFAAAGTAARAEDASTVYANPAGMTRLDGDQVTVAAQALYGKLDYKLDDNRAELNGKNPDNAIGWAPGASAFYSHSMDKDLKLGVGVYNTFGLSLDFGNNWAGENLVTEATLIALTVQPTVSYKINNDWSVGGGLTANYGYFKLKRDKILCDGTGDTSDGDWAYGARLGLMFQPSDSTRVGLVWGSQVNYDFNVDGTITLTALPGISRTITVDTTIKTPQQLMMSAYHRIDTDWAIMGNVGWQQWSKFADSTVETTATGTVTSKMSLQDTWHAAFGGQYTLNEKTKLNAGVAYDTSMYDSSSDVSFFLPAGDTWRFGTGVEYALSSQSDLGFAFEYASTEKISDSSRLIGGSYNHPELFFMAANYSHRF
jgi:long-chain fatty acid transport protein